MSILNFIVNKACSGRLKQIDFFRKYPGRVQERMWTELIRRAETTEWGRKYGFLSFSGVKDFQQSVPLQAYEEIKPDIDRVRNGERDVLWPGVTKWFARSSGTTDSKSKFVPVTRDSLHHCHYRGGRDVLAVYIDRNPQTKVFAGKTLTLGGSHQIDHYHRKSFCGDLSAVMIENVPFWVHQLRTPSKSVALLNDFDRKIEKIAETSVKQHVVSFAGVPSWNLALMKYILDHTGKNNMMEIWPDMELFIHGGVCFLPYREQYRNLFPSENMHYLETYNASEGFFALQDDPDSDDMLLMLDYQVFFEFIPLDRLGKDRHEALTIEQVEKGVNYAIVISTNSGLWRYIIGDTVMFTSLYPHKIKISGRTRQFINAFGEEIIVDNAEKALLEACKATGAVITEYTAGPVYMDSNASGAHEWLIEFEQAPDCLDKFTRQLDAALCSLNSDYEAKRSRNITLRLPVVRSLPKGTFYKWMKHCGKLGGQNKVPRLSNDRRHIEAILTELQTRNV
ncbi:MAG: GH3 auxin-responsive promoter family protein [Bacteroidales bacterium]|jgi:hypothetical protein|nr:GH3 auxin-responsive promoter family protein [Bacteroidales bacterium]